MLFTPESIEPPFQLGTIHLDNRDLVVPCLEVAVNDTSFVLHWGNSLLRAFYFQEEMNHLELRTAGTLKGVRLPQDILSQMEDYAYPIRRDPLPDEQTIAWFISVEARSLDDELGDLL